MKKILAFLFAVTLLFSFAGCTNNNTTPDTNTDNSQSGDVKKDDTNLKDDIKDTGEDLKDGAEDAAKGAGDAARDAGRGVRDTVDPDGSGTVK